MYSHYFTETIQRARQDYQEQQLRKAVMSWFRSEYSISTIGTVKVTGDTIVDALKKRTEPDMDLHARSEATDAMEAYYKVAMKVLVDNFATLCIEKKLLDDLPELLSLNIVMSLDDHALQNIPGKTEECQRDRALVTSKLKSL